MRSYKAYIAQEGQIQFTTAQPYIVGAKTLFVYLNGILCSLGPGEDYVETDEWTISFNTPAVEGDRVTLIDISDGVKEIDIPTVPEASEEKSKIKQIYEYIYPAANGQTKFYPVNTLTGDISVAKNGKELIPFAINTETNVQNEVVRYIETDPLTLNDYIIVKTTSSKSIVVGDYGDPIYKRYGASTRLMYNQIYTGHIEDSEQQLSVNLKFTSRYDPLYCATKLVKGDIEPVVTLSDDEINFIIYSNSMKVLIEEQGSGDQNYTLPVPYSLSDPKKIPYNIQMRVRYASDVDILYAVYLKMTGKQGRTTKKLANMEIDKEVKLPYLSDFLSEYKSKLAAYTASAKTIFTTAVKGETGDPWAVSPRRSF